MSNEGRLPYPPEDHPPERGAGAFHPPPLAEGAGWLCVANLCHPPWLLSWGAKERDGKLPPEGAACVRIELLGVTLAKLRGACPPAAADGADWRELKRCQPKLPDEAVEAAGRPVPGRVPAKLLAGPPDPPGRFALPAPAAFPNEFTLALAAPTGFCRTICWICEARWLKDSVPAGTGLRLKKWVPAAAREGIADELAGRPAGIRLARVGTTGKVPCTTRPCRSVAASTPCPKPRTMLFPNWFAGMVVMARRMPALFIAKARLEL